MRSGVALALAVVTVAVAGCVTYRPEPLQPSETAARFAARRLDDEGLRRFIEAETALPVKVWPPAAMDFEELTLAALYFSPDLDVARAQLAAAEAGVVTAGQRANPALAATPEWVSNAPAGVTPWVLSVALDVPLTTAGKRTIRIAEARNLSEVARLRLGDEAWQVRSRLRVRLVDLWQAGRAEALLLRQDAAAQERMRLLDARFANGEAARLEVILGRRERERVALALGQAREERAAALVRVAEAIGVSAPALAGDAIDFGFTGRLPAEEELGTRDVRAQALLNRPDILAALAEYAASEAALQLEVARQYPDIHLGPGYTFDKGSNQWALGVALALPVMNRNQGPIAEAEARRREAAARFVALQARVAGEVDGALAGYRGALATLGTARALLAADDAALAAAAKRFIAGEAGRLSLVDAEVARSAGALAFVDAQATAQRALGRVEDAVRRPLAPASPLPAVGAGGPRDAKEGRP
ncbi:MAG: TolC family protein [Thermoanaerobaculaceae bacterium]|nr:TolC family protein [Thermoanaerobaculaceae bacterium]